MINRMIDCLRSLRTNFNSIKLTKFNIFLAITLGYAIMIFYLSSISDLRLPRTGMLMLNDLIRLFHHSDYALLLSPLSPLVMQRDKLLHIMLYFGFGLLLYLTLRSSGRSIASAVMLSVFIGALYGVSDEFHQVFVPGRSAGAMDIAADVTGVVFAQIIIILFYSIRGVLLRLSRLRYRYF